jgi:group I intron endonuclease
MMTMEYPKLAGVYKLICLNSNKIYIGKSINISKRLQAHKYSQKRSSGRCFIENVIIKYGWDSFKVEILEVFSDFDKAKDNKMLLEREAFFIALFNSTDKNIGYNICRYSQDRTGICHTNETKLKISKSKLGKRLSETHKNNIKTQMSSVENREKMRNHNLGKVMSDETKEKIRMSHIGKRHTTESKEKMKLPKSENFKEKIRISRIGKKHSEHTKDKLRKINVGKKLSEEPS